MLLKNMPQHSQHHGQWIRQDQETFDISSTLYESPADYDYWLVHMYAKHQNWGNLIFQLHIPKQIANSVNLAKALIDSLPLEQVKSILEDATEDGCEIKYVRATDGWFLINGHMWTP